MKPGNYGKRELIAGVGHPVTEKYDRPKKCLNCKLDLDSCKYFECGQCKVSIFVVRSVYFCGKRVALWKQHKTICQSIFALKKNHQQNAIKQ